MLQKVLEEFQEAVYDTDQNRVLEIVHKAIDNGVAAEDVVFEIVIPILEKAIQSISEDDSTCLSQMFFTAQIAAAVTEEMIPLFKQAPKVVGCVVIGTSSGDFHGLGKRIVIGCLKAMMIDVIDLGLSVPPERFVDEAVANKAQLIGISSMMVHTARGENGCLKVRQILKERGLEEQIKIIVGGAPYRYDHELYKVVQADAWTENAITSSQIIKDLIKEVQK
ncbi:cobalamin B12-binding domain-containing protein [Acetobacterium sp.]|uniref:cobalamin B12-binding domain-containing protein n=1 Tax=Acetobacterium sp. TaxID=1872094 RepID=UPI002F423EEF